MTSQDLPDSELPQQVAEWFAEQREFWRIARANGEDPPDPADYKP